MTQPTHGSMVQDYYVARYRALAAQRDARLDAIRTRAQALRYRDAVRRQIQAIFGPRPARTPLRPRITGVVHRPRYLVEKVIFESRPGYYVSANLYLPRRAGKLPAVLGNCGHSGNGKAWRVYQRYARGLAEHGFVVLIWDPVSQGERLQFEHEPKSRRPRGCVYEHMVAGKQLSLVGEFFGAWHAWDGIRALDYLLGRPEVDRSRVGVTGNSGGGTLTTYLNALDGRFTMAAPGCFITTYLANLENELPADNEQIPPGIVAAGLEMGDFFIARAPRPVIFLGQHNDFFDERGLRKTYEQVRRFYGVLGAADRVRLHVGPGAHGFQPDARKALYRFFNHHAGQGASDRETNRPVEKDQTLWAAPRGQVWRIPGHRFIHDQARDIAEALAKRRRPSAAAIGRAIADVLQLPTRPAEVCHYRVLRPIDAKRSRRYDVAWPFAVETEPGIQGFLTLWEKRTPATPSMRAQLDPPAEVTLHLPHLSSEEDVFGRRTLGAPRLLYTLDPRGMGRSTPVTCDPGTPTLHPTGVDFFYAGQALMLGESYLGRRVHDVLRVLDLLEARGAQRVHLVGRGMGAVLATFAATLHPLVTRVTLRHALRSFHELTQTPVPLWPMSAMPWGVLRRFDLPDCYRALRRKKLRIVEPWDAHMKPAR